MSGECNAEILSGLEFDNIGKCIYTSKAAAQTPRYVMAVTHIHMRLAHAQPYATKLPCLRNLNDGINM